mmetsp:Transcript_48397/g.88767  ORF Transcript_48397/g.88767 Transcript_48397/m.88767 type:complete len:85 (+) Transcript_48397:648-902(+)
MSRGLLQNAGGGQGNRQAPHHMSSMQLKTGTNLRRLAARMSITWQVARIIQVLAVVCMDGIPIMIMILIVRIKSSMKRDRIFTD